LSGTLTLSTANTYTGGTTVSGGTLVEAVHGALPSTGAVAISGATLQLAAGTGLAQTSSLSITANGTLDITNNHIIINYGKGTDPIASIAALLKSGYNGGAWTGTGITSTTAQSTSGSYGIGYADSADPGNPAGLSSGQIEIKYTLLGDANLDGAVNGSDFAILATNFNKAVSGWDQGDFNYDGSDNGSDFALLAANFNKGSNGAVTDGDLNAFAANNGLLADVPEPASMGIALLSGLGLLAGRRRRNN
jgi:MYXO-CTERM domain-containing protein